jgi:hypothetical protein
VAQIKQTSSAKKGGLFVGKSHAEGGIPAIVTDTGQPIEVEGGEAIINKKATALHWEELSKINQSAGNGVPIPPPDDADKVLDKYSQGGKITVKEKKLVFDKWRKLVNMTYTELSRYFHSKDGQTSGLTEAEAKSQGISSGRESAEWILKMKKTNWRKWSDDMWKWANKQISFISRMSGMQGELTDEKGKKTPKYKALLIWGNDPKKKNAYKFATGGSTSTAEAIKGLKAMLKFSDDNEKAEILAQIDALENSNSKSNQEYIDYLVDFAMIDGVELHRLYSFLAKNEVPTVGLLPEEIRLNPEYRRLKSDWEKANKKPHPKFNYPKNRDRVQEFKDRKIAKSIIDKKIQEIIDADENQEFATGGQVKNSKYPISNTFGWTKEKIVKYLKSQSSDTSSTYTLSKYISEFDNWQQLKEHIFYHGTSNYIERGLKPSITMTEKQAEKYGGGGYGERYFGISLTKRKRTAESFSGSNSGVTIYPVILKRDAKIIERTDLTDASDIEEIVVDLYNSGVDAVWIGGGEEELTVVNPYSIILYKDGSEYFSVYGGFKSTPLTDEQIKDLYENSKVIWEKYSELYNKAESKDEANQVLRSIPKFKFKDGGVPEFHLGGDMSMHLAPNNQPSNLTHEQWHLVRTPEFKAWFGDWENSPESASQVVDENGEPLVVWRGESKNFNVFDYKKLGSKLKTAWRNAGFFFAPTKSSAEQYMFFMGSGLLKQFFLNIRNPYTLDSVEFFGTMDWGSLPTQRFKSNKLATDFAKEKIEEIKSENCDGAFVTILKNDNVVEIIAFNPNQIKLADGTNTTFDENNPDIRFKDGGEISDGIKDFSKVKITNDYYPQNIIAYVDPKELLDRHLIDEPDFSILIKQNQIGNRVEKAKKYLEDYLNNPKIIDDYTNQRTNYDARFNASVLGIYNGKLSFTDGRHRVLSAYLLGLKFVPISIPKNQVQIFKESFSSLILLDEHENTSNSRFEKGGLIAPNGQPSGLYFTEIYNLVRTPEFKAWFGDWEEAYKTKDYDGVSKIIDENGEPLICVHNTNNEFYEFDEFQIGSNTDQGYYGKGFYFTPTVGQSNYGQIELNCFLNIKNPYFKQSSHRNYELNSDDLKDKGYDGVVVYPNWIENMSFENGVDKNVEEIVTYYPEQIKLGNGTNTTFDKYNPDIRFEDGGAVKSTSPDLYENKLLQIRVIGSENNYYKRVNQEWQFLTPNEIEKLKNGTKHELEHTATIEAIKRRDIPNEIVATFIAYDHINEDPNYYQKLDKAIPEKMENGSKIEENKDPKMEEKNQEIVGAVSKWNEVPVRWRNVKAVRPITFNLNPYDKNLNVIVKNFLDKDPLRPVMSVMHFADSGVVCTDAHKLLHIHYKNSDFKGNYATENTLKAYKYYKDEVKNIADADVKVKDDKFPNWEAVIPKESTFVYEVDTMKLYQYLQVAINYANPYTNGVIFKFDKNMQIGFNGKFLMQCLEAMMKMQNCPKLYLHLTQASRSMLISYEKSITPTGNTYCLSMPILLPKLDEIKELKGMQLYGAFDIDNNKYLTCYFDFEDSQIHNGDGSVADYQESYGDANAMPLALITMMDRAIKIAKPKLPILENICVDGNGIRVYNFDSFIEIANDWGLENGLYQVKNNALVKNTFGSVDDYPRLNNRVSTANPKFTIDSDVFKFYLEKASQNAGNDDLRPVMKSIFFQYDRMPSLDIVATDGITLFRGSLTKYAKNLPDEKFDFMMGEVKQLMNFVKNIDSKEISISVEDKRYRIDAGRLHFEAKLEDGKFPNWQSVVPNSFNKELIFDVKDLYVCMNNEASKMFAKETQLKADEINIFNQNNKVFISNQPSERNNIKQISTEICELKIENKIFDESKPFSSSENFILLMPNSSTNGNYFNFKMSALNKVISTIGKEKVIVPYSDLNRAYIFTSDNLNYKTSDVYKPEKVKSTPAVKTPIKSENIAKPSIAKVKTVIIPTAKKETPKFTPEVIKIMPKHQLSVLRANDFSEMETAINVLNMAVARVPKLYGQDGIKDKVIYLHYFYGNQDWYVAEMDKSTGECFGYADFGYGAELGYMSIPEFVNNGKVELDFYFEPKTWSKINKSKDSAFEKQNKVKTIEPEEQSALLDEKWRAELKKTNGASPASEKARKELFDFNKKHFPVIITLEELDDYLTNKKFESGDIDFSKISGWIDDSPFTKTINHKISNNDLGDKIGLKHSRGGGSAFRNFKPTKENAEIIKKAYEKLGYKVELNNNLPNTRSKATAKNDKEIINLGNSFSIEVEKQFDTKGNFTYGAILFYKGELFKYFVTIPNETKENALKNVYDYLPTLKILNKYKDLPRKGDYTVYYKDRGTSEMKFPFKDADAEQQANEFVNDVENLSKKYQKTLPAKPSEKEMDIESEINHYKNILKNIDKPLYKGYIKKNVEKIISELESKIKSTEKIMGTEYTVGTKAHATAIAKKKQFDDLEKSESGTKDDTQEIKNAIKGLEAFLFSFGATKTKANLQESLDVQSAIKGLKALLK